MSFEAKKKMSFEPHKSNYSSAPKIASNFYIGNKNINLKVVQLHKWKKSPNWCQTLKMPTSKHPDPSAALSVFRRSRIIVCSEKTGHFMLQPNLTISCTQVKVKHFGKNTLCFISPNRISGYMSIQGLFIKHNDKHLQKGTNYQ